MPAELRRNGRSRCVPSPILRTNVAPTACGPAVTGTRTCSRASMASDLSVMAAPGSLLLGLAADRGHEHTRAIDRDLDLMRMFETTNRLEVGAIERQREVVFGVEREVVGDDQTANRSERQTLDVLVLRSILPDAIRIRSWRDRRTDGQRADAIGGDEIALEQCRRRAEHLRHVVEAERRVVWWQQRRDVDVERQQIANRVRILTAIEASNQRAAWIRRGAAARRSSSVSSHVVMPL